MPANADIPPVDDGCTCARVRWVRSEVDNACADDCSALSAATKAAEPPKRAAISAKLLKNVGEDRPVRIVDARTGANPTAAQHIIRYLGYFVSILPLFLGALWVAFDPRKQVWHAKLAGTVVVRPKVVQPTDVVFK
jgi:RDD family protein